MIASGSNRVKKKSRALHLEGRKDTLRHCQNWLSPTPYNPESALGHLIQLTGTPWAQPLMAVLPVWECQSYGVMEVSTQISEEGLGDQET